MGGIHACGWKEGRQPLDCIHGLHIWLAGLECLGYAFSLLTATMALQGSERAFFDDELYCKLIDKI